MNFPHAADHEMDDLPRTVRREKEAREREAREREAREREAQAAHHPYAHPYAATGPDPLTISAEPPAGYAAGYGDYQEPHPSPAVVKAFDVPFLHLVAFFLKAVFAAIPALIVLGALIWGAGEALEAYFPEIVKMKILISFPNS